MKNLGEIKDGKDIATKEYVDKKVINPNLLKDTDFSIEFDKDAENWVQTYNLVDCPDTSVLIGKKVTLSFYLENPGNRVDFSNIPAWATGRFGAHLTVVWENTETGATVTEFPIVLTAETSSGARVSATATLTPPSGCNTIASIACTYQLRCKPAADNDATWVFARPKLELGDTATEWCPHVDDFTAKADKTYVDTQDNAIKADVAKIKTAMDDKADKASIIDTINSSVENAVISADKVEVTSCCATGSFVNDSTAVIRCDTGFGAKPKIFKLYYIANGEPQLAAELHPYLDSDLQKFIYSDLPITTFAAAATGIVGIKFSTATGMTFFWEAYK